MRLKLPWGRKPALPAFAPKPVQFSWSTPEWYDEREEDEYAKQTHNHMENGKSVA
jgi:hypothetical protein